MPDFVEAAQSSMEQLHATARGLPVWVWAFFVCIPIAAFILSRILGSLIVAIPLVVVAAAGIFVEITDRQLVCLLGLAGGMSAGALAVKERFQSRRLRAVDEQVQGIRNRLDLFLDAVDKRSNLVDEQLTARAFRSVAQSEDGEARSPGS